VIRELQAAGFELVDRSDLLAVPDDDHSEFGAFPRRWMEDRMLLKFRKPSRPAPGRPGSSGKGPRRRR